jgi:hypothetical protein
LAAHDATRRLADESGAKKRSKPAKVARDASRPPRQLAGIERTAQRRKRSRGRAASEFRALVEVK